MAEKKSTPKRRGMLAHVIDYENGLQTYEDLKIIRIHSKRYNLLIMDGYAPCIGAIEGTVTFVSEEATEKFENVRGFFMHKKDVFRLMLREDSAEMMTESAKEQEEPVESTEASEEGTQEQEDNTDVG